MCYSLLAMTPPADFYLYQGEQNRVVPGSLRACRRIGAVPHNGQTVTLVAIDPPLPKGTVAPGVRDNVLGLSQVGLKSFDRLSPGETATALAWEVYDLGADKYGVALQSTLGRCTIAKAKPAVDSRGAIMQPSAAARAFVASITRALSDESDKKP
jgi:hypothetical protein